MGGSNKQINRMSRDALKILLNVLIQKVFVIFLFKPKLKEKEKVKKFCVFVLF